MPEAPSADHEGLSMAAAEARLTAAGMPFQMVEQEISGVSLRVWKNAPPTLRSITEMATAHGDAPYIVFGDERMSYADHDRRMRGFAHALIHRFGVEKGDRVAIAMRNLPEWPIAFWATVSIGAVAVPLNAWWTGPELEFALSDCGASVLIVDQERFDRLLERLPALPLSAIIIARPRQPLFAPGTAPGAISFDAAIRDAPADAPRPDGPLAADDLATIFYTSGTTGRPKGAVGTHRNMTTNVMNMLYSASRAELRRGVTPALLSGAPVEKTGLLLSVPFFHATGCHSVLATNTLVGNKIVLMHKWNADQAIELIERERLSNFGGVPAMVWQVLESPSFAAADLSTIRNIGYGGAPAAPELVQRITQAFPDVAASNGYGLTETSSLVSANVALDYRRKPDSVGVPVAVCDVKTVDPSGAEIARGAVGELWIRGPNVVQGYWGRPEANAATFSDGWLHTGDLARIDEEGFIYIVDRAKDMLIRGGENVYCVEVEDALYAHPAVMDAAVVGIPHRVLGEEVGAIVQLAPGREASPDELRAHVAARLAAFKVPVRIELRREPLPRNANGKILKRQLREELVATIDGAAAE